MSNPSPASFDKAVAKFFVPLAANAKLPICKLAEGIYEVQGVDFTMRIRRGIGHRKGILVTLLPTAERPADANDLSKEIGLGAAAEFRGETPAEPPFDTEDEYLHYAHELAAAAERILGPYLVSGRTDFAELKDFVAARAEAAASGFPDHWFLP